MPSDTKVFEMRLDDRQLKEQKHKDMIGKRIYEKHLTKKKNFKALLAEDDEDIQFYEKLRKREMDKISNNKQGRSILDYGNE